MSLEYATGYRQLRSKIFKFSKVMHCKCIEFRFGLEKQTIKSVLKLKTIIYVAIQLLIIVKGKSLTIHGSEEENNFIFKSLIFKKTKIQKMLSVHLSL